MAKSEIRSNRSLSIWLGIHKIWGQSQAPKYYQRTLHWALLIIAVLAYGLLLPRLGYFWDDWPWVWLLHDQGSQRLLTIDQVSRPLAGEILWIGSWLAGESPLGWQVINWLYRWLTAISLVWMLRKLWPGHLDRIAWIAFIFLVYPAFRQQYISINSSRHILPMAVAFLSIGCMVWAARIRYLPNDTAEKSNKFTFFWLTVIALSLMALEMLATEYYYGWEIVRPVFLWMTLASGIESIRRFRIVLLNWLPYLGLSLGIFIWRYLVSPRGNYPIIIVDLAAEQPSATIQDLVVRILQSFASSVILAWKNIFDPELFDGLGIRYPLLALGVVIGTGFLIWIYLIKGAVNGEKQNIPIQMIVLGVISTLTAVLPFLVTGIDIDLNFPADRTYLPLLFGSSLIVVGVIDWIIRHYKIKTLIVALLTAAAVGMHLMTAVVYYKDWQSQKSFFHQLITRAPGLQPGTTILYEYTLALQNFRSTDNSLKAPLNWLYASNLEDKNFPINLVDLRLRDEYKSRVNEDGMLEDRYGEFTFTGSSEKLLPLSFLRAGCINVLDPKYAGLYPHLPDDLAEIVQYGNLSVIDEDAILAQWPEAVFGPVPEPGWCTYYQEAELARQRGDWLAIAAIGDRAFQSNDPPREPLERFPFILGYAYSGNWERASELTWETRREDVDAIPILCAAWKELRVNTPNSPDKAAVLPDVINRLDCR